jgi:hypothetical protein
MLDKILENPRDTQNVFNKKEISFACPPIDRSVKYW